MKGRNEHDANLGKARGVAGVRDVPRDRSDDRSKNTVAGGVHAMHRSAEGRDQKGAGRPTQRTEGRVTRWASNHARKDRLYAAGLCITCGKRPHRVDRVRCWDCSANELRRQRWELRPFVRRCGRCKQVAMHDRRRCAE